MWSYLLSNPVIETELQDIRILSFLVIQKILALSEGLFFAPNSVADTTPTWKIQWNPALRSPRYYGHFFWPCGKNRHTFSCKKKTLFNTAKFFGPLVTVLTGFHCTAKYTQCTVDGMKLFKVVTSHQVVWIVLVIFKQTPPGLNKVHYGLCEKAEWEFPYFNKVCELESPWRLKERKFTF